MAPFSLMSIGNVLVKTFGLFSTASTVRCLCIAPALKNFSTSVGGRPKKPLSSYLHYVKEQQPVIVRQHPDIKGVDVFRKIAQQWGTLTPEQKRPFEELSVAAKKQYEVDLQKYQAQFTPAEIAAMEEERRQKMAKREAIRKKRELNNLGKPKRPRTPFNIFMAEHFEEAKGTTMPDKMKSLLDEWRGCHDTQKQVYVQLAEDDKVRYKNEIKVWEEHMTEMGREDLVRRKEKTQQKTVVKKGSRKKSQKTVLKAEGAKNKSAEIKSKENSTAARSAVKKTGSKPK
ncbi:transcription factor A, mitochondrial [Salminus brasiliensis]|uniref:transcription factor A, mitochondrial n=1 Tax=Salminus brasiliensis TaxID=930266 RepID=UPI003B830E5B